MASMYDLLARCIDWATGQAKVQVTGSNAQEGIADAVLNTEGELLSNNTRSNNTYTPNLTNYNARGIILYLNVSDANVGADPLMRLRLIAINPVDGTDNFLIQTTDFAPGGPTTHTFVIYPGAEGAFEGAALDSNVRGVGALPLPRVIRIYVEYIQDITDLTYSLGYSLIL